MLNGQGPVITAATLGAESVAMHIAIRGKRSNGFSGKLVRFVLLYNC